MNLQPLVFISHGHRDIRLAREFSSLLSEASGNALPVFYSSSRDDDGIPFASPWFQFMMERLWEATTVVALLTPRSIARPWLAFEAGVALGTRAKVFGVALGLTLEEANQGGPFAHFQNCQGKDEALLTRMVQQLISYHHLKIEPTQSMVHDAVRAFLVRIQDSDGDEPETEEPSLTARLFEEVKLIGRDLRKHDFAKIVGPRLFRDFPLLQESGGYDATGLLLLLGILREDLPWLYEIGLDLHRAFSTNNMPAFQSAREQLLRSVRAVAENDWFRSILAEKNRELAYRLHTLPGLLESYLRQLDPKA